MTLEGTHEAGAGRRAGALLSALLVSACGATIGDGEPAAGAPGAEPARAAPDGGAAPAGPPPAGGPPDASVPAARGERADAQARRVGGLGGGRYLPLVVGTRWTYRVRALGPTPLPRPAMKTTLVEARESLSVGDGTVLTTRVSTRWSAEDVTVNWDEDTGDAVYRWAEVRRRPDSRQAMIWVPRKLRLDESPDRLRVGARWTETYQEVGDKRPHTVLATRTDEWTVEATDDPIEVPAGAFRCLRLRNDWREESAEDGLRRGTKTYWYARGVGKVAESSIDAVEELVRHEPGAEQERTR